MTLANIVAIMAQLVPLISTLARIQGSGLSADDQRVLQIANGVYELASDIETQLAQIMDDGTVSDREIDDLRQRKDDLVAQWHEVTGE